MALGPSEIGVGKIKNLPEYKVSPGDRIVVVICIKVRNTMLIQT